jgi:signal transduction histidine kinase
MSLALPAWARRPSDRTKDVALAVLLALPVVGTAIVDAVEHDQPLCVPVGVAAILTLWWRRLHPVAVLAVLLLLGLAMRDEVILFFPAVVVLYQVAATRSGPVIAGGVLALLAAVAAHRLLWYQDLEAGNVLGAGVFCGFSVALGLNVAARRVKIAALQERAERLDRERELLAEQAVSDERVRIARELHDVVAHNVSLMVVQAQALGATVKQPGVLEMTTGIADLGRQTMTDMHRTLELLRDRDHTNVRAPRPGLGNLDTLVAQSREAGLEVDVAIEGAQRPLSQSLDLSAFRIVQEALTNVRLHAPGATTHVTVGYGESSLALTIRNLGVEGAEPASNNGGHGLTGMRERAALFGGTLAAGPRNGSGYEVHAVLPYGEDRSA